MDHKDQNSSDSEPEEVSKHVSEKEVKQQLQGEQSARVAVRKQLKEKRRQEIERNTKQKRQKKKKVGIQHLPDDLLNELEDHFTTQIDQPEKEVEKKPTVEQRRKKSSVKKLDTAATEFKVMSYDEINTTRDHAHYAKNSCFNFRDRMLFGRKHNKRVRNWRVRADQVKRSLRS